MKTPTPVRSPERARLAEAIARVAAIQADIDWTDVASAKIGDPVDLYAALDAAEKVVAESLGNEARRIVDEALGRPSAGPSLAEATAARDAIAVEQERRRSAQKLLGQERAAIEQRLGYAHRTRDAALAAVLRGSAEVDRLLNDLREARERLNAVEAVCLALTGRLPDSWGRWDREAARAAPATVDAVRPWREALGALVTDADAPLPGGPEPDEPTRIAA